MVVILPPSLRLLRHAKIFAFNLFFFFFLVYYNFCFYIRSFQPRIIHSLLFALQSVESLSLTCAFFNFTNPLSLHQKQSAGVESIYVWPSVQCFLSAFVIFRHFPTTIISNQFTMKSILSQYDILLLRQIASPLSFFVSVAAHRLRNVLMMKIIILTSKRMFNKYKIRQIIQFFITLGW